MSTMTEDRVDTGQQEKLFDIPAIDGHKADTIKFTFGGGVEFDLMDDAALEFFNKQRLLTDVELRVTATVTGNGWKAKKGEDDDTITNTIAFTVHSIDLAPEDD